MTDAPAAPEPDRVEGYPHPRETARLFGQPQAEAGFLSAWAEGRLHHGWLIRGPRGVGKATLAYRIARALIADGPGVAPEPGLFGPAEAAVPASLDIPAGCPVAARIRAQSEPRLAVLRRSLNDKGRLRSQIAVDDIRAVRHFLGLTAADGGWRVVLVDAADEMNTASANALLKMLEEPPKLTAMLLVSHSPAALLPTIRSRCRTLDLRSLGPADLAAALDQAGAPVKPGEAEAVAILAGGSVGEALRLTAAGGLDIYRRIVALMGGGRGVQRSELTRLADAVSGRNAEPVYDLATRLTLTLVGRLARHGATGESTGEAAPGEAALMAAVARTVAQAALWAEVAGRLAATIRHARAVNLDPGQTIIDTFLELDTTLAKARGAA